MVYKRDKYEEAEDRLNDWNLASAFEFNNCVIDISDVERVVAVKEGERDGENWVWLMKLKDKRYAVLEGGCDYTGWDCRSHLHLLGVYKTVKHALKVALLDEGIVKDFKDQILKGKRVGFRDKGIKDGND